jgi:hypothetical protein
MLKCNIVSDKVLFWIINIGYTGFNLNFMEPYVFRKICKRLSKEKRARGSVVGWGTVLQARKVVESSPDEVDFFQFT